MIVLDTNVVSEPMKPNGNPAVQAWLDLQVAETLYLTATSLLELLVGIEILPDGKRKEGLDAALAELITRLFESRILPFDQKAAGVCALDQPRPKRRLHNLRGGRSDSRDRGCAWIHCRDTRYRAVCGCRRTRHESVG